MPDDVFTSAETPGENPLPPPRPSSLGQVGQDLSLPPTLPEISPLECHSFGLTLQLWL